MSNTQLPPDTEKRLYRLVDSFLVEAKDQHGNDRSLERLNEDRHLFVQALAQELANARREAAEEIVSFIDSCSDGSNKYWSNEAFEEYFEDRGYKYGPRRFVEDLKKHLEV